MNEGTYNNNANYAKSYFIINEVLSAVTHGIGLGLSIAGLVFLILKGVRTGSTLEIVSYTIYGSTLILLYLSSTLYHSLSFTQAKKVFKVIDHSNIFLLIAGTYIPYLLITIGGVLGWTIFWIIWAVAILGIIYKSIWINKYQKYSILLYIIMGWLCIIAIKPLYLGLGFVGFGLMLAGGISFTVGAIFYRMKNVKFMHVVWHLFVLAGTILMYFSILFYV